MRERLIRRRIGDGDGFRWRGEEVWRVEGFSDAVFAFAITLLVVSLEVPRSFDELLQTMRGFFAFAICFVLLVWLWSEHYKFFRRYGLRDSLTMQLNSILLFLVLFFVYPLKFLFTLVVAELFNFGDTGEVIRDSQYPLLMMIYGTGFIAVQLVFVALHWRAYFLREPLGLNARELWVTRTEIQSFLLNVAVGLTSVTVAAVGGEDWINWSGWIYVLILPLQVLNGRLMNSRWRKGPGTADADQDAGDRPAE